MERHGRVPPPQPRLAPLPRLESLLSLLSSPCCLLRGAVPFKSSIEAEFEHDATMYGENRARMLSYFRADGTVPRNAVIVLDGGKEPVRDETGA